MIATHDMHYIRSRAMSFAEWKRCQLDIISDGHVCSVQCALARCRAVEKVHFALLQWCGGGGVYKCKEYIGIMKEQ